MDWLFFCWGVVALVFVGAPVIYNLYMKRKAYDPWDLTIDETYKPSISILVPAHNEEKTIGFKLRNLTRLDYPADKMEIILVNDASIDATSDKIDEFLNSNSSLKTRVLNRTNSPGKSNALNSALQVADGEVIVVSDADCFLSPDSLKKCIPFLSDPTVGAVAGREMLLNPESSWVTRSEVFFSEFVQPQRIGESKTHSTLFFQGGLAAYKRNCLREFDAENDDSGTALGVVQTNNRAIIVPEARFHTTFPVNWKNKVSLKMRRASQLQSIWLKCFRTLARNRLVLPKRIAVPEIFLQVVNPIVFLALILLTVWLSLEQSFFAFGIFSVLIIMLFVPKSRMILVETVQNYLILLVALLSVLFRHKFTVWETAGGSRLVLNEKVLQERNLI